MTKECQRNVEGMPKEWREDFSPTYINIGSKVSKEWLPNGYGWRHNGVKFREFPNFPLSEGGGSLLEEEKMTYNPKKRKDKKRVRGAGYVPKIKKMSAYDAKQEALHLMRTNRVNPGTTLSNVVDLLAEAGVWTEDQLMELTSASRRTLQRYRRKAYLDLAIPKSQVTSLFAERNLKVYCLGPIGLAIAEMKYSLVPKGYLQGNTDRVTHDLLCNQVFYHLYKEVAEHKYVAILKGKYEATLHDQKGRPILEPDAMIVLRHEITGKEKVFLVEYHNENFSSRAAEKVRKYEYIYSSADWRDKWNVETFPTILIGITHRAPALGYKEDIDQRQVGMGIRCKYMIKSVSKLINGDGPRLDWLDLEHNRFINILNI